jgi:hypothetical protein
MNNIFTICYSEEANEIGHFILLINDYELN